MNFLKTSDFWCLFFVVSLPPKTVKIEKDTRCQMTFPIANSTTTAVRKMRCVEIFPPMLPSSTRFIDGRCRYGTKETVRFLFFV